MRFFKENKGLFLAAACIPPFLFYFDEPVMAWIREVHKVHPDIGSVLQTGDRLMYFAAHGTTMIAGAIIFYLFCRYIKRVHLYTAKALLIGLPAAGIGVQIVKHIAGRARPRISDSLIAIGPTLRSGYDSFPSGHTAMAFCLAYILSRHYPPLRFLYYTFAAWEGLARIDGTSHFPSDVIGGAIFGIIVAKVVESKIPIPAHGRSRSKES